jgi:outer membrane receptor protein involved in Fe transport
VFEGGRYDEGIPNVDVEGRWRTFGPSQSLLSPTTDIAAAEHAHLGEGRTLAPGSIHPQPQGSERPVQLHRRGQLQPVRQPELDELGLRRRAARQLPQLLGGRSDDPVGFFRFNQPSAYVSDNWRVTPNLSVEMGLRWEWQQPIYTQGNNISNFDPRCTIRPRPCGSTRNGSRSCRLRQPVLGADPRGDGIPSDQQDRVTIDEAAAALSFPGAPRGLYGNHHLFMPRFSGAYTLRDGPGSCAAASASSTTGRRATSCSRR